MKLKFFISTDNPQLTYFPGQKVSGNVCIELDRELKIEGIQLKFLGQAEVKFSESRTVSETNNSSGINNQRQTDTHTYHQTLYYKAKEEFFHYKIFLVGNKGHKIILPAGLSVFPFTFTLPFGLPSSYCGKHGRVVYLLDAKIKGNFFGLAKKQTVIPFTINGILDLNNEPNANIPVEIAVNKSLCCLCCKNGPISLKLIIPRKGFVPGENIRFLAEINNCSRKSVSRMEMTLIQKDIYIAKLSYISGGGPTFSAPNKKTRSLTKEILKQIGPGVTKGDSESWDSGFSFRIPPIPPTKLAGCKIIDVQYTLHFEVKINGMSFNISQNIPIIIGTIPLRSTFQELMPMQQPNYSNDPGVYTQQMHPQPELPNYPDIPPPSYEFGNLEMNLEKFENTDSNEPSAPAVEFEEEYAPNYVMYGVQ